MLKLHIYCRLTLSSMNELHLWVESFYGNRARASRGGLRRGPERRQSPTESCRVHARARVRPLRTHDRAMKSADGEKYQLRPRASRGRPQSRSRRQAAPLSKYRRKTANARERSRMREINRAFEALRRAVPAGATPGLATPCEKLTKITTLRLAMRYISALSAALRDQHDAPAAAASETSEPECWPSPLCSDLSDLSSELGQDASDFADDSLTPFESFLAEFNYIERTFL